MDGAWNEDSYAVAQPGPTDTAWLESNQAGDYTGWLGEVKGSSAEIGTAADGSVLIHRGPFLGYVDSAPSEEREILRVTLGPDHVADTEEIDGTAGFERIHMDLAGHPWVADITGSGGGDSIRRVEIENGQASVGAITTFPDSALLDVGVAIDPSRASIAFSNTLTDSIDLMQHGSVVSSSAPVPGVWDLVVEPDHGLLAFTAQLNTETFQYEFAVHRVSQVATVPRTTTHPRDATVRVENGVPATATFTVEVTGDPEPTVQWQARAPGGSQFSDVDGATGTTLTVDATVADDGGQYRAVVANQAGSIVSEAATLTVEYSPVVIQQPVDHEVVEGDDATLRVEVAGNPAPQVRWQGLVDGSWSDLPSGSDAYSGVESNTLMVHAVTVAQDDSRFRVEVSSSVETEHSDTATLTVTEDGGDPDPGEGQQQVTVDVPDVGAGEFSWSIDGTGRTVTMSASTDQGDHWASTGQLVPITVSDTRAGGPGWSITGQVSDFTGGISGSHLGWTPTVVAPGAGAAPGDEVVSGFVSGEGLSTAATLASADAGHAPGTATIGADLDLRLPIDTPAGTYTATLTITALS